jgi:general stress protein 13
MAIAKERVSTELMDKAVNEIFIEEENKGFKRGELKPFLENLSEKYDIPFHSLKNRYYRDVKVNAKPNRKSVSVKKVATESKELEDKKKESEAQKVVKAGSELDSPTPVIAKEPQEPTIQKINSVDESIKKFTEKPADKYFTSPKDHYKINQEVDIKISNIQSYGAFVEILDGKGFTALLHISQLINGFIEDVNDYLEVGQIIKNVKICHVDLKKLNVTTKHLSLKKKEIEIESEDVIELPTNPPVNNIGEKFGTLKDKLLQRVVENTNVAVNRDQKEIEEIFALEELSQSQEEMLKKYEKDILEMTNYLQNGLGVLSKPAKLELAKIIEDFGLFNATRGILKTQENFRADIGLLFMQQMRSKIGEYL